MNKSLYKVLVKRKFACCGTMKKRSGSSQYIIMSEAGDSPVFQLQGAWTVRNAAAIQKDIAPLLKNNPAAKIDLSGIGDIDTAGAWLIKKHFGPGADITGASSQQTELLKFLPDDLKPLPSLPRRSGVTEFL